MWILSGDGKTLLRAESVQRICLADRGDACLIIASFEVDGKPVTLGRYDDKQQACEVVASIYDAVASSVDAYAMPGNTGGLEDTRPQAYHGHKPQRHGKS